MLLPDWTLKTLAEKAAEKDVESALVWLQEINVSLSGKADILVEKYIKKAAALDKEKIRMQNLRQMEEDLWESHYQLVGGIDEAGRGPLAGPVVASCVILPRVIDLPKLNDSKKISSSVRDDLYDQIKKQSVAWAVGICDAQYIDYVNILNATKKAMIIAVQALKVQPDALIIDAVKLSLPIHQIAIPKADEKCAAVSAASILAKVTRDRMMDKLDKQYPEYGFIRNKGYGTEEHIAAIREHGLCPLHRISFTKNFVI